MRKLLDSEVVSYSCSVTAIVSFEISAQDVQDFEAETGKAFEVNEYMKSAGLPLDTEIVHYDDLFAERVVEKAAVYVNRSSQSY
jgi:hypothetical protein